MKIFSSYLYTAIIHCKPHSGPAFFGYKYTEQYCTADRLI